VCFHRTFSSFITNINSQFYEDCKHFQHTCILYSILYFYNVFQIYNPNLLISFMDIQ
jgi:hypothetical protein